MVKPIYWIQHTQKNKLRKKRTQRWKSVVRINEQRYTWKNNEKINPLNAKVNFLTKMVHFGIFYPQMAIFYKNILKIWKTFLWVKNFGGNLSCQCLLAVSKFGNFTKARINENMFYMQGVNIHFVTMRFIKV